MTKNGKFCSTELTITCGVPQGSVLGPLLFIIYINDLFEISDKENITIVSYADDTAMLISAESWEELRVAAESVVSRAKEWLDCSKLHLNVDKTVCLAFSIYSDKQPTNFELRVHEDNCNNSPHCSCSKIKNEEKVKYLGVMVDKFLRWNIHVTYLLTKLRYLLFVFRKLKRIVSQKIKIQIYHALFASIAFYGVIAWGGGYDNSMRFLENLQKRVLKTIFLGGGHSERTKQTVASGILSVKQKFYLESVVGGYLTMRNQSFLGNTRTGALAVPKHKKKFVEKSSHYVSLKVFNLLPKALKQLSEKNVKNIKRKLKLWILYNV